LILYFLCKLSAINKLNQEIKNRIQLYNKIIEDILFNHQTSKENQIREIDEPLIMDLLLFCASKKFEKGYFEIDDISEYLKTVKNIKHEKSIKKFIEQTYLLNRTDEWNYNFILQSFYEYFLAKNLADNQD